jgi:hypothetical protein
VSTSTIEKVKVQPKLGDILYSSWGYDQTNIDFYKVVKVSEFSVWIQELGKKIVEITGWAHEKVVPTDSSEYRVKNWDNVEDNFGNVRITTSPSFRQSADTKSNIQDLADREGILCKT